MAFKELNYNLVYSVNGAPLRLIKRGEEVLFVDAEGDEIPVSELGEHFQDLVVEGGESQPFIPDDEETEDEDSGDTTVEVSLVSAEAELNGTDIVLTVTHTGPAPSVRIGHDLDKNHDNVAEGEFKFFTLYADEGAVWDANDGSEVSASAAGVSATYEATEEGGVWVLTVGDGVAKTAIEEYETFKFYVKLRDEQSADLAEAIASVLLVG